MWGTQEPQPAMGRLNSMAPMLGKGKQGVPARVECDPWVRGLEAQGEPSCERGAGGAARASGYDRGHPSTHPSQPSRKSKPQPGSGLRGASFPLAPSTPRFRSRVLPSHLPAERRSLQPSECGASLASDRSGPQPPRPGHAPACNPAPGHASPCGCDFA